MQQASSQALIDATSSCSQRAAQEQLVVYLSQCVREQKKILSGSSSGCHSLTAKVPLELERLEGETFADHARKLWFSESALKICQQISHFLNSKVPIELLDPESESRWHFLEVIVWNGNLTFELTSSIRTCTLGR